MATATLHPKPCALNPTPKTLNPTPYTLYHFSSPACSKFVGKRRGRCAQAAEKGCACSPHTGKQGTSGLGITKGQGTRETTRGKVYLRTLGEKATTHSGRLRAGIETAAEHNRSSEVYDPYHFSSPACSKFVGKRRGRCAQAAEKGCACSPHTGKQGTSGLGITKGQGTRETTRGKVYLRTLGEKATTHSILNLLDWNRHK